MTTLVDRIRRATERGGRITFVTGDTGTTLTWDELHQDALGAAAALQQRGIGAGAHVALLSPTSRPLVTAIQAVWLAGATVVVLPLPMRLGSIDEFVQQTRARIASADTDLVLVDAELLPFIEAQAGDAPLVALADVVGAAQPGAYKLPDVNPGDLAVLQFTSGSTSDPKGVMLPHHTVLANLEGVAVAAELDPDHDVLVSWLPLYHDMGLIGLLTLAMITGTDLVLGSPQDFMASPGRWMQWMSDYGGTATAGPNFSYALAARALRRMEGLDLSRWRVALNGAEPVDPDTVDGFCAAAARHGFDPLAAFPAFGMAEVAIAGTFPRPKSGVRYDVVHRETLEKERYAAPAPHGSEGARRLAFLGRAIPGLELRICDPVTGAEMCDREVGELEMRGTSVTPGYYNRPDATAELFHDGWMRTGDLGYLVDGELVLCGRMKDLIIIGGRNVFPEDVERAVAGVEGVRAGNVIAFGVQSGNGRESLVVAAETKGCDDLESLRERVAARVRDAVGVPAKDIVLLAPGTLPKTSSGKLQRSLCRTRYVERTLERV